MTMEIYKTNDGELVNTGWLMWEFIKSTEQVDEFNLFKSALIKESFTVHR